MGTIIVLIILIVCVILALKSIMKIKRKEKIFPVAETAADVTKSACNRNGKDIV